LEKLKGKVRVVAIPIFFLKGLGGGKEIGEAFLERGREVSAKG